MRKILALVIVIAMVSCDNPGAKKEKATKATTVETVTKKYAVVWDVLTNDHNYVMKYLTEQAEEFNQLFADGVIENAYLNNYEYVKLNNDAALASVMFFVKAESVIAAQAIIDKMSFVRNKVATYNVYPVGGKWLDRKPAADINKKFSFATVWFLRSDEATVKKFAEKQSEMVVALWKEGVIENAYFATENAFENKTLTPGMVFFVNADNEEEAREICDGLVFSKEGVAKYELFPVGTFWLGSAN